MVKTTFLTSSSMVHNTATTTQVASRTVMALWRACSETLDMVRLPARSGARSRLEIWMLWRAAMTHRCATLLYRPLSILTMVRTPFTNSRKHNNRAAIKVHLPSQVRMDLVMAHLLLTQLRTGLRHRLPALQAMVHQARVGMRRPRELLHMVTVRRLGPPSRAMHLGIADRRLPMPDHLPKVGSRHTTGSSIPVNAGIDVPNERSICTKSYRLGRMLD